MNFAAPSAMPGPAKEKVDAAKATAATLVAVERIFFISTSLILNVVGTSHADHL
jgi:hypothetical protein